MAGDWIKMSTGLARHPKVVRMASALRADRLRVVGGLHAVWCLFDEHSTDGKLQGYTTTVVDDFIGWTGFTEAMVAVEWAEVDAESVALPSFDTHNGKSAKRRAMESDRKRSGRLSASDADVCPQKVSPREEKRREEKKIDKPAKSRANPKQSLPNDFGLSDKVRQWADTKGYGRLEDHLEAFLLQARAKDYQYVDWDAALMNAIRDDWAKLRVNGNGVQASQPGGGRRAL